MPPYTEAWDEAFPPDTQLVKLGAQDFRDTKRDIRERVSSFGAGLLADRPTPETDWMGVTYIATDTDQLFVWDGANWQDITTVIQAMAAGGSGVLNYKTYYDTAAVQTVVAPAAPTQLNSVTIPAAELQVGDVLHIHTSFSVNAADTGAPQFHFGSNSVSLDPSGTATSATPKGWLIEAAIVVISATAQRLAGKFFSPHSGTFARGFALNLSQAISGAIIIKTMTPVSANTWTSGALVIERLRG